MDSLCSTGFLYAVPVFFIGVRVRRGKGWYWETLVCAQERFQECMCFRLTELACLWKRMCFSFKRTGISLRNGTLSGFPTCLKGMRASLGSLNQPVALDSVSLSPTGGMPSSGPPLFR